MPGFIPASIQRLARSRPRGTVGYAAAVAIATLAMVLVELRLEALDHGTHLLIGLVLVLATAITLGPGPATTGMVLCGGASVAAASGLFGESAATWTTIVRVAVFLLVGGAFIVLVTIAVRSRSAGPATMAPPGAATATPSLVEPLTERELEVLRLSASGVSVEEVAHRLYLSPNTVKTHLTHVYAKLGVRGRSDAIRAGLHVGCLVPGDICPHRYPTPGDEPPVPVSDDRSNR